MCACVQICSEQRNYFLCTSISACIRLFMFSLKPVSRNAFVTANFVPQFFFFVVLLSNSVLLFNSFVCVSVCGILKLLDDRMRTTMELSTLNLSSVLFVDFSCSSSFRCRQRCVFIFFSSFAFQLIHLENSGRTLYFHAQKRGSEYPIFVF